MEETVAMVEEAWSSVYGMFPCPSVELPQIWYSDQETRYLVGSEFSNSDECLASQENSILSSDDGQPVLYTEGTLFHFDDVSKPGFYPFPAGEPTLKLYSLGGLSDQYELADIGKFEKLEMDFDRPRQNDVPNANASENKKRSRNVIDVSRSIRNLKSDKSYQMVVSDNVTRNCESKSSISHSTEEHSIITHGVTKDETRAVKTSKTSSCKSKSGKGASSDPQTLYARKRRERINERLRILQTLVPNGTKVDISTMLEEAVQYVKFLQLQIRLLSSDETWMYAPLAYNGMDIGISNFDITTNTYPR